MDVRLSVRFIEPYVKLPYSFFQTHTSGDLLTRLGSNNAVPEILTSTVLAAFVDGTMALVYLAALFVTSVPLTLLVVVLRLVLARVLLMLGVRAKQRALLGHRLRNQAEAQTLEVEMISGMETLKSMGLEHVSVDSWSAVFAKGLSLSIQKGARGCDLRSVAGGGRTDHDHGPDLRRRQAGS